MNKKYLLSLLTCLMMVFTLASCGSDDKKDDTPEPAPAPVNAITITNNTSTSFMPLYICFRNVTGEVLNRENLGDLYPNETVSARIPGSTATWFLYASVGGQTYYTADHLVSETSFTIQPNMDWYLAN
jgi:hypothetical protein